MPQLFPGGVVKILTLFNNYRSRCNGERQVVMATQELLRRNGLQTLQLLRSSERLEARFRGKVRAFCSGPYSRSAYREVDGVLRGQRPDIVHAHNLYPLLSPSVLVACRRADIPTVMTLHNFGLTCPTLAHFHDGQACEKCLGGREYWCVTKNCRDNLAESIGYGLRAAVARRFGLFHRNVSVFIVGSLFAKNYFAAAGFDEDRISVLPNMVEVRPQTGPAGGLYVAYAGRITEEKGIRTLLDAARHLPQIPIRIAGDGPLYPQLVAEAPPNVEFVGFLDREGMMTFYREARCVVVPSGWFEMCPLVILEAMAHGLPVIASRIGGLPELVVNGETGLLFTPSDAEDLAQKIETLYRDPGLCLAFGHSARETVAREYNGYNHFSGLMAVYEKALSIQPRWIAH